MLYQFYNLNIDIPLSRSLNTPEWESGPLGQLHQVNDQIYLREIPYRHQDAAYGWRVVDAYFTAEDSTVTYFQAYGLEGQRLPQAVFGVNWPSVPGRIGGGFSYPPEFRQAYYVPVEAKFHTPNTGGYTVQVLDMNYPSEGMSFGLHKAGKQHQALVVSFRLFELGPGYPNDGPS